MCRKFSITGTAVGNFSFILVPKYLHGWIFPTGTCMGGQKLYTVVHGWAWPHIPWYMDGSLFLQNWYMDGWWVVALQNSQRHTPTQTKVEYPPPPPGLQHKTNHYVRSLTKQPQLTNIIRNRRLKWFGHVLRMDPGRIPRTLYLWNPTHGKWKRGRPRTMWKDVIQNDLKTLGLDWSVEEAKVATHQDRALWRFFVGHAASAEMHDALTDR